jgi:hypothetical protein
MARPKRGRGGTVTGHVTGFAGHFFDHLGAHVFELVFQFDLLGHGDAVFGDRGDPQDLSMTTFLPLGPKVTTTASASALTPLSIASRAFMSYFIILPAIFLTSIFVFIQ